MNIASTVKTLIWIPLILTSCLAQENKADPKVANQSDQKGLFLSWQNPVSKRYVILEELDGMVWLYLTAPNTHKPIRDCPAFITKPPVDKIDWKAIEKSGDPPSIDKAVASPTALIKKSKASDFNIRWSLDGQSVALIRNNSIICMIVAESKRGHSKALSKKGPLGLPFDEALATRIFDLKSNKIKK